MICRIGYRSSERIWLMKVFLLSHGETLRMDIETLPVLLMNYQWSREQKWNRAPVSEAFILTSQKDPNCDICLKTKITRASCRRRAGTVVPRAEHFGDLITADHKVLGEGCESRHEHRYAVVVQDLATQWSQSYPCKNKNFSGTTKYLARVPGADEEAKSHLPWQFLRIWKILWRIILESLYDNTTQIRNKWDCWESSAQSKKEGTSAVLLQSGLNENWWADSMECCCYLRNIQDFLSDGKTPYERRFGNTM